MERRRVLLVEDDDDHRRIVRRSFEALPDDTYKITDVATVAEARTQLSAHVFDVMIVDWKLRDGSGMELLPGYEKDAALPIIVLTLFENEDAVVDALRKGAIDFVVKTPDVLRQIPRYVEKALREWELRRRERFGREQLSSTRRLAELGYLAGHVITHRLNNVLGALLNYGEVVESDVEQGVIASRTKENVKLLLRRAEEAADIVDKMRAFTAKERPHLVVFEIGELVADRISMLKPILPAQLKFDFQPDGKERFCSADVEQFRSMVMNLITNASDAIPRSRAGLIRITLDSYVQEAAENLGGKLMPPGVYHRLIMEDNGKGLPSKDLRSIFEPFVSLNKGGTGLGLATARHFVNDELGGSIWAESEWNKGAKFSVVVPASGVAPQEIQPEFAINYPGNSESLLVVDDESDFLNGFSQKLERLNYRVKGFTDPKAAIEYYRMNADKIDLVITDQLMPDISGLRMFRELRQINREVRGLIVSGYTSELLDDAGARQAGFEGLLHKPVRRHVLAKAVHQAIHNKRR